MFLRRLDHGAFGNYSQSTKSGMEVIATKTLPSEWQTLSKKALFPSGTCLYLEGYRIDPDADTRGHDYERAADEHRTEDRRRAGAGKGERNLKR